MSTDLPQAEAKLLLKINQGLSPKVRKRYDELIAKRRIVPRSQGGETTMGNLALSCQGCNNHKYTNSKGEIPC